MNNEHLFHSLHSLQNYINAEFAGPEFDQMMDNDQDTMLINRSVSDALIDLLEQWGDLGILYNNDFLTPVDRAIGFLRNLVGITNEVWSAYLLNIFDEVLKYNYEVFHSFLTRIIITVSDTLAQVKDQPQLQNHQYLFL
jgi:hypothetical protein